MLVGSSPAMSVDKRSGFDTLNMHTVDHGATYELSEAIHFLLDDNFYKSA